MGISSGGLAGILEGAAASAVAGYGVSQLTKPGRVSIPPPPGATMLSQAGSAANAGVRARQAAAGGLNSTVTGAGASAGAGGGPTSGGKQLLGA